MTVQADLYVAAGDLVNWGRGLERVGPVLAPKAQQMYVLPGNHESEDYIGPSATALAFTIFGTAQ